MGSDTSGVTHSRKAASPLDLHRPSKNATSSGASASSPSTTQLSKQHHITVIFDTYTKKVDARACKTADEVTKMILKKYTLQDLRESQSRAFTFYVLNGREPDPRMVARIDQEELLRIAIDPSRPEQCVIMRKPHTGPPSEGELEVAAGIAREVAVREHNANLPRNTRSRIKIQGQLGESWETLQAPLSPAFAVSEKSSKMTLQPPARTGTMKALANHRPPSELITDNLPDYFPDHDKEHLDNTISMSIRRSMRLSRALSTRFSVASNSSFSSSLKDAPPMPAIADRWREDSSQAAKPPTRPLSVFRPMNWRESVASSLEPLPEEPNAVDRHSFISFQSDSDPTSTNVPSASAIHDTTFLDDTGTSGLNEITKLLEEDGEGPDPKLTEFLVGDPWESGNWIKGTLIGQGSFGSVYLALHGITGEFMAVKQVEMPDSSAGPVDAKKKSMIEALRHEISLLNDLKHPNIVQYLGSSSTEQYLNIFLEYVPGGSVAAMLIQYSRFPEVLVRKYVRQILAGLAYLHNKDIIHRDIKGANVLVDNKGNIKISDFGISRRVEASSLLEPGQTAKAAHRVSLQGSVFWMAPEVVKQRPYTKKADIWSLGCLVVEMFTGQHPFPDLDHIQAMFKIGDYKRPGRPDGCSDAAAAFLDQTFEVNLEKRPSAEVLLESEFLSMGA